MLLPEVEVWGRGNSRLVVYRILSLDLGRSILWRFFQVVFEFCMQIFLLTMWKKRYLWFDTIQMHNTNDLLYVCISQISSLHVRYFTTLAVSSRHQTQEVIYHAPVPILPASSRSHNCGQGVGKIRFEGLHSPCIFEVKGSISKAPWHVEPQHFYSYFVHIMASPKLQSLD